MAVLEIRQKYVRNMTFSDLTPGEQYVFTVRAKSAEQYSELQWATIATSECSQLLASVKYMCVVNIELYI